MALNKKPNPLPSEMNYVPPNSVPYRVVDGDSWYSLAEIPAVKGPGMSPNDLCYFNFRTRNAEEINWYLYNKVGCRRSTKDGKNHVFSSSDQPGIIYLPKLGPQPPVHTISLNFERPVRTDLWFGILAKTGTMFGPVGIETAAGPVVSLDEPGSIMAVTASTNRLGLGGGVGVGMAFVFVMNVSNPMQLTGHQEGDWDFNISLGANWGKMAKSAKATATINKLEPVIKILRKIDATSPAKLKAALKAHPDKWIELVKAGRSLKDSLGIADGGPKVFMFDVPFLSGGAEVSVFFGVANFNAVWDSN